MNINQCFPSDYLRAVDLGHGRDYEMVMDRVELREMDGQKGKEDKPVLFFQGAKKGLVLNKTNATTIQQAHGPETENWSGQTVVLHVVQERAFGELTDCIRVVCTKYDETDQNAVPF